MSSSTGKGLEQRGDWDVGGVDGGEGNRVGRMGGGEGGSRTAGDEGGKNTTGLTGESGEGEACFEAGLDGDDVQERDLGDAALVKPAGGVGGVGVSRDTQGAGEGVFVLGCEVLAEGEPTAAGGRKSTWSEGGGQGEAGAGPGAAMAVGEAPAAGLWTLVCVVGEFSCEAAGPVGADGTSRPGVSICGPRRVARWRVSLSRAVLC